MDIKGFLDISFVDWDGKVASVIFLPNCNFRCPFCHNRNLVLNPETIQTIPFEQIEAQLESQKNWIDGVCITGGEPTLHSDLPDLCLKMKRMGFLVKLDTNGTNSIMLKELIEKNLIDYIAMDVKAPLTVETYSKAIGVNAESLLKNVKKSIKILMSSGIDYEFRTTVVPSIHELEDIKQISTTLKDCKKYALQKFDVSIGQVVLDPTFNTKTLTDDEMQKFVVCARAIIPHAKARGTEEN